MDRWSGKFLALLLKATEGRLSLKLVLAASLVLFWIAFVLFVLTILFRTYQHLRSRYRASRRDRYHSASLKIFAA